MTNCNRQPLAYQLYTDKTSHNLLFRVDFQHNKSNAKYADAMYQGIPTIDLADPNYDLFAKQPINLTGYQQQDDITQRQLGVYLQDEMQWDKLTVVAGLRRDNFKSNSRTPKP